MLTDEDVAVGLDRVFYGILETVTEGRPVNECGLVRLVQVVRVVGSVRVSWSERVARNEREECSGVFGKLSFRRGNRLLGRAAARRIQSGSGRIDAVVGGAPP